MHKFISKQNGFSLLEIVVVIYVITMGLIGVSSLVMQNIQVQYINKNTLIATQLAQEGLELVRNSRDTNWLKGNAWDNNINIIAGPDTFIIAVRSNGNIDRNFGINDINNSGARLYVDNPSGRYNHNSGGGAEATPFRRLITVTGSGDNLLVESRVRWTGRGGSSSEYAAETYLYEWK